MPTPLTIALDAMGGDRAPHIVIEGAALARERHPDARFLLFGDEERIKPLLDAQPKLAKVSELRHTPEAIPGEMKPSQALRTGRESSMWKAIQSVREGEAGGIVSAGNTGALMAISKFVLRMAAGVDRPAIASFFPTLRGESCMLDLGANIECDVENLVQFAIMGSMFARAVLGIQDPTVGLLNVGEEELKGNETVRGTHRRLRETTPPFSYVGFVEGNDITSGRADVIVTDGFTGNVALKTAEGVSKLYSEHLRIAFRQSLLSRLGYLMAGGALRRLRARLDPRRYNGAVFLGLNGIAVKAHGGSDGFAFGSAVDVAIDMVQHDVLNRMTAEIERLNLSSPPAAA